MAAGAVAQVNDGDGVEVSDTLDQFRLTALGSVTTLEALRNTGTSSLLPSVSDTFDDSEQPVPQYVVTDEMLAYAFDTRLRVNVKTGVPEVL